jgi:hypothetical protein
MAPTLMDAPSRSTKPRIASAAVVAAVAHAAAAVAAAVAATKRLLMTIRPTVKSGVLLCVSCFVGRQEL